MQENERDPYADQPEPYIDRPEPEEQPPSEREMGRNKPESEPQPTSESVVDEGQPQQRLQPPPAAPIPLPLSEEQKRHQYFLGLVCGLIPLAIFLAAFSGLTATGQYQITGILFIAIFASIGLYVVEFIVTIVCLAIERIRFAGYGLFTAFMATPVVVAIGCTVIPTLIHP